MTERFIESNLIQQDQAFEIPLRPQHLQEFVGQEQVRERLQVLIEAAQQRGEPLPHCLFSGPPGLGKTTLANILAKMMGSQLIVTSGPVIEKPGDLAGILTNLKRGDILFIDEIHRLNRTVEEYLYPAMEDYALDLIIDSGPNARTVNVQLNHFTLVGATTRMGLLSSPLRTRFPFTSRLEYYSPAVLEKILERSRRILNFTIDLEGIQEIALRARGTPRIANNLLRWARDYAQTRAANNQADRAVVRKALELLSIDERGLDEMDLKILATIIDHYEGGPVGLSTIAVAVGEDKSTLEEVYEPFLIGEGFLKRTLRGREATLQAYRHLGRKHPQLDPQLMGDKN